MRAILCWFFPCLNKVFFPEREEKKEFEIKIEIKKE